MCDSGKAVRLYWIMLKKELLAVFSGFPELHFSEEITRRLRQELTVPEALAELWELQFGGLKL